MNINQQETADLGARVQQLVKVYGEIHPLLVVLATLPIVPLPWRAAMTALTEAVDSIASFKSGKDL